MLWAGYLAISVGCKTDLLGHLATSAFSSVKGTAALLAPWPEWSGSGYGQSSGFRVPRDGNAEQATALGDQLLEGCIPWRGVWEWVGQGPRKFEICLGKDIGLGNET